MIRHNPEVYLLHLTGEEQRSTEDKRWIYIWTSLAPLIGLSVAYAVQLHQVVRDLYVLYGFPVVASLLMASVLWNLLGGYSRTVGYVAVVFVSLVTLTHNAIFALQPNFPALPLYVNTASYWTLAVNAGFILTFLRIRAAVVLVAALFLTVVCLPWLLNPVGFTPFAAPLVRSQAMLFTLLLTMVCLAWYRARFTERAAEALMLRELTFTDLFVLPETQMVWFTNAEPIEPDRHSRSVPLGGSAR